MLDGFDAGLEILPVAAISGTMAPGSAPAGTRASAGGRPTSMPAAPIRNGHLGLDETGVGAFEHAEVRGAAGLPVGCFRQMTQSAMDWNGASRREGSGTPASDRVLMMAVMPLSRASRAGGGFRSAGPAISQDGEQCVQGIKDNPPGADFIGDDLDGGKHAAQVEVDGFYNIGPMRASRKTSCLPVSSAILKPKKAAFSRTCRGLSGKRPGCRAHFHAHRSRASEGRTPFCRQPGAAEEQCRAALRQAAPVMSSKPRMPVADLPGTPPRLCGVIGGTMVTGKIPN